MSIITEYCSKGSLNDVLQNEGKEQKTQIHSSYMQLLLLTNCYLPPSNPSSLPPSLFLPHSPTDIPLNWGFRLSFATDIARGMVYLHNKRLYHGRLTSSNCVIDGRWVVKISGNMFIDYIFIYYYFIHPFIHLSLQQIMACLHFEHLGVILAKRKKVFNG